MNAPSRIDVDERREVGVLQEVERVRQGDEVAPRAPIVPIAIKAVGSGNVVLTEADVARFLWS
jgi:hypothetical protein